MTSNEKVIVVILLVVIGLGLIALREFSPHPKGIPNPCPPAIKVARPREAPAPKVLPDQLPVVAPSVPSANTPAPTVVPPATKPLTVPVAAAPRLAPKKVHKEHKPLFVKIDAEDNAPKVQPRVSSPERVAPNFVQHKVHQQPADNQICSPNDDSGMPNN